MDLMNIKRIEDLTIMSDVNRRLKEGWVLIGTYSNNYDPHSYPSENTFHYVLGLAEGTEYLDIAQNSNYSYPNDLEK
jgi:hypothetical protein